MLTGRTLGYLAVSVLYLGLDRRELESPEMKDQGKLERYFLKDPRMMLIYIWRAYVSPWELRGKHGTPLLYASSNISDGATHAFFCPSDEQ
jgi:hypothetical protein